MGNNIDEVLQKAREWKHKFKGYYLSIDPGECQEAGHIMVEYYEAVIKDLKQTINEHEEVL